MRPYVDSNLVAVAFEAAWANELAKNPKSHFVPVVIPLFPDTCHSLFLSSQREYMPLSGPPATLNSYLNILCHSPSAFWALAHTIGPLYWKHIVTMTLWLVCNFLGPAYLIPSLLTWRTLSPSENSG